MKQLCNNILEEILIYRSRTTSQRIMNHFKYLIVVRLFVNELQTIQEHYSRLKIQNIYTFFGLTEGML